MKGKIRFVSILFSAIAVHFGGISIKAETIAHVRVSAMSADCLDVAVHAVIELPQRLTGVPLQEISVKVLQLGDRSNNLSAPGQLVLNDKEQTEVWWIIPHIKADDTSTWTINVPAPGQPSDEFSPEEVFSWQNEDGEYIDLLFDGRKVTRYMYAYDTSSEQRTFETYKPFHHVYDASGNLLTNGPDGVSSYLEDEILCPHHRGIFIGWNRLTLEGRQYDMWHMPEVHQVHQKFMGQIAGPVLARSTALIHWNDKNGEPIIIERRQTTVFRQSDPTILLLDYHTELKAAGGNIFLEGDPEHAGFQYRAHDTVDKGGKEDKAVYLFHKDGIDPKKDCDLPWVAMSYRLSSGHYSVQHMNHPDNPKPTFYSAYRDYGRFGVFFTKEINAGRNLKLSYRVWVGQGEMPGRQEMADRHLVFVNAPAVEVSKP